jgi:hypothetical protein
MDIFLPYAMSRVRRVQSAGTRFVHYTTADAAIKIIRSESVWMRSSSCMADYQEIEYGLKCLTTAYQSHLGERLRSTMDGMFPGFSNNFARRFAAWVPHFREQTYFTCISEHDADEDDIGRLSMWRAFGKAIGVALVFNNKAFLSTSNALSVYSTPVAYLSAVRFDEEFEKMVSNIEANVRLLREQSEETVLAHLFHAFRFAVLSTKHPGFSEEREWRIVYAPTFEPSKRVTKAVEVIGGVPQTIFKIPLHDVPEEGLMGVSVPTLLDRIIIGPTQYPGAVSLAVEQVLSDAGVVSAAKKIWVSDIPLRSAP